MDSLNIAVDFDQTFSADPDGFTAFIKMMQRRGHDVKFVTARNPFYTEDIEDYAKELGIDIIYCSGAQKVHVTAHLGWNPDIWIDDAPEAIPSFVVLDNTAKSSAKAGDFPWAIEKWPHEIAHKKNDKKEIFV